MPPEKTLRDIIGDGELPEGLEELFAALEQAGWYPRARRGTDGIACWPDNGRGSQVVISTRYPLNAHKLEEYRTHTGLPLEVMVVDKEG